MAGNTDPVDAVAGLNSLADVSKADVRSLLKTQYLGVYATAAEVLAGDLSGRFEIFIREYGGIFRKNTGDTTTPTSDVLVRDANGIAFERQVGFGSGQRIAVRAATTANITIATALNNGDTLDGLTLATNDLVLVKDQTTKAQNGVYVVGVTPARSTAFDTYDEHAGAMVAVASGTANANTLYFCTANEGGILGTTDIEFTKISVTSDVPGDPGPAGADGTDPGILLTWDADTADSDQGAGKVWANNATLTSATVLYISKTNRAGSDIAAKLARLDDSTNPAPKGEGILTRTADGAQLTFAVGAVTDATNYVKVAISGVAGAAGFTAADAISFQNEPTGDKGADGAGGASALTRVRVVATANVAIATALENGDAIDGVTLATGDLALLTAQSTTHENGVYVVPASGAASRHSDFDAYDELPGAYFSVMEGTAKADTLWRCTSDRGGTIGSTAVAISEFGPLPTTGTWTPTLGVVSGTDGTHTYSTQTGQWWKHGPFVFVAGRIVLSAKDGAMSGSAAIKGLPYPGMNSAGLNQSVNVSGISNIDLNVAGGYYSVATQIAPTESIVRLNEIGDNVASAALTAADFGSSSSIAITGVYLTDA